MKLKRVQSIIFASLLSSPLFAGFDSMNPLQSTTHTSNSDSQNTQVNISWNRAVANGGDNLGGYYYLLDQNEKTLIPTVVDARSTLGMSATGVTVTVPNDGIFHFHLAPYADSGNIGATLHFNFIKIDTVAPTTLGISPNGGSFNSIQTVSISAVDTNSFTIYYTIDNSTPTSNSKTYTTPFTLSSTKTLKAIAIDTAGNSSPISSSIFTISNSSNVAQFGNEITAGARVATNNSGGSSTFVPTLSIEGVSVTEYKFKIDTGSYSAQIAKSTPISLSGLQDGTHTISIVGYDGTSLQLESEATTLSFIVDNTAPDNVGFSLASGTTITSNSTITLNSNNSTDIYYSIDGSQPDKTTTKSSTIAVTSSNNGTFTLKAIAYDLAGNKSSVKEAIYTVTITSPTDDGSSSNGNSGGDNGSSNNDNDNNNSNTTTGGGTTDNTIVIDDNNIPDNVDNNNSIDDNDSTDNRDNNNSTDNTDNNNSIDDNDSTDNVENNNSTDNNSTSNGGSTLNINLPFTTDDGGKESVNIDSDLKNTNETKNSDGTITVTASTQNIKNELKVNRDGTVESTTTIGSNISTIKVNTIGADTHFNADGSITISSNILNSEGSSIGSNVEVKANGEMINRLNITVKDGIGSQSVVKSDIAGTDSVVGADGSMTITTPTIITAKNQKIDFEIVINVSGEIIPTLLVDGTEVSIPQFEAGSKLSIKTELNKILLIIETLLTEKLTFN